ncbi:hypothetical protein KAJ83_17085 [Marivibrio halodurans]|uniref:Uncharacterized protein n=1 Tax=Marivibrio halodurans TaxID=2039722 RepID=A0A8J7S1Q2_9PROT|nr:hypothetical protein [Marivibrio halodurans]MBP5858737.1 hypothetical protein [Marivibrio halodurans]
MPETGTMRRKLAAALCVAIPAILSAVPASWDPAYAGSQPDPDARIGAHFFFRYLPEGTVADCLVTFSYDEARTDPDADLDDLGGIVYLAAFDYARAVDFRIPGIMRGSGRRISYVFPSGCDETVKMAGAIADRANESQSEIHVTLIAPDSDLLKEIGGQPMWKWQGFDPRELALRESAMASPCRPDGWREVASWYLGEAKKASIGKLKETGLLTRYKLISSLSDVLAGADTSDILAERYDSAEERAFVKAMLDAQLSATECN